MYARSRNPRAPAPPPAAYAPHFAVPRPTATPGYAPRVAYVPPHKAPGVSTAVNFASFYPGGYSYDPRHATGCCLLPANMTLSPPEGWYHGRPEVQLAARKERDDLVTKMELMRDERDKMAAKLEVTRGERDKETEKLEAVSNFRTKLASRYLVLATLNPDLNLESFTPYRISR